jgi:hypothetical protein
MRRTASPPRDLSMSALVPAFWSISIWPCDNGSERVPGGSISLCTLSHLECGEPVTLGDRGAGEVDGLAG